MRYKMTLEELHAWLGAEEERAKGMSPPASGLSSDWGYGYSEGYLDALETVSVAILGERFDVGEPEGL